MIIIMPYRAITTVIRGYKAYISSDYKTYIFCPKCGKGMRSEMEVCPHCNADVPTKDFNYWEIIDTSTKIIVPFLLFLILVVLLKF